MAGGAKAIIFELIANDHASSVFERVGASAEAAAAQVELSERKMGKSHDASAASVGKYGKVAGAAFAGVTAAAGIAAAASVKMAGDFQQKLTLLVTGAGESQKNIKKVSDGILKMAGDTGTAADDLAKSMYLIESAGYHGADGLKVLKAAAQGAKTDGADLSVVADALTTVMRDMPKGVMPAATAMSKMVAAVSEGKMRMDDFAGSIHNVLPNAVAVWVKSGGSAVDAFNQVAGALATMTAQGIGADQASQNLNHTIIHLAAPTLAQTKAMAAYGLSATDVAKNVGKRGLIGTLELLETTVMKRMGPAGLTLTNAFNTSKEAAKDAAREFANLPAPAQNLAKAYQGGKLSLADFRKEVKALPGPMANLLNQWATTENASKGFSQMLRSGRPAAQTFSGAMKDLTGDQTGLQTALHLTGQNAKDATANIRHIAKATQDSKGNVKDWDAVQKNFNQTLAKFRDSIDALLIRLGLKLLPVAQKIVQAMMDGASWVGKQGKAFDGLRDGASRVVPILARFAQDILPYVIDFGKRLVDVVVPGVMGVWQIIQQNLIPAFKNIWPVLEPVGKLLLSIFGGAVLGVISGAFKVIQGGLKFISGLIDVFSGLLTGHWGRAWKGLKEIVSGAFEAIIGAIQVYLNIGILSIFRKGALFLLRDIWAGMFDKLASFAVDAAGNISGRFIAWFVDLGKLWGKGLDGIKALWQDAWDTIRLAFMYAWDAIKAAGGKFIDALKTVIATGMKFILDVWLGVTGGIIDAAAKLFWWVPGVGGKLTAAAKQFDKFKDNVNASLDAIIHPVVDIKVSDQTIATIRDLTGKNVSAAEATRNVHKNTFASGGYTGDGGKFEPAGVVHRGEFVVPKEATARLGVGYLNAISGLPGYATGGFVNIGGIPSTESSIRRDVGYLNAGIGAAAQRIGNSVAQAVQASLASSGTGAGGGGGPILGGAAPGGVARWRGVVLQVLSMLGQPASLAPGVLRRMAFESGGNPRAINLWDVNAKNGDPSRGLMQTIGSTFNAYAGPFRGRGIYDPLANVYAGLNYALHRYGSIQAIDPRVRPRGYDTGGLLKPGLTLAYNGTGRDERIRTGKQEDQLALGIAQVELQGKRTVDAVEASARETAHALAVELRRQNVRVEVGV